MTPNAERSQELVNKWEDYNQRDSIILISDQLRLEQAITAALDAAEARGLERAAEVAQEYWRDGKNVYARHAGRAVESRIRALIPDAKGGSNG
jgi:hypothetical protein